MTVTINGTTGIVNAAIDLNYTGTLTGGTGVVNLGSGQIYKDTSGNVGLGVTPSAWTTGFRALQIGNTASFVAQNNSWWLGNNWVYNSGDKYIVNAPASLYSQQGGTHIWWNAPSGTAGNPITFTQAMTLDSSSNLLVGTTVSNVTSGGYILYPNAGATLSVMGHTSGTASGADFNSFWYAGSKIGSITQNGTTGVLYNLTSDYRLKDNPTPLTGAKDFVMALQPKTWDWWDGSGKGVGFIAHEFMEVAKYSGNGEKDAVDADGKPVYQSIQPSSSEVMANLVAFIQELKTELDTVKAELTAMKGQA